MFLLQKPEVTWKSPWRIEQERRRAEEMGRRVFVAAPQIRERQLRVQSKNRLPNKAYFKRRCDVCSAPIRHDNITGRCIHHKLHTELPRECAKCPYMDCGRQLNKQNGYGLCKEHYTRFRRLIHRNANRCFCGKPIRKDSRWDKCRAHSKKERSQHWYQQRRAA